MSSLSAYPAPLRFSSDSFSPRDRVAAWKDFAREFIHVEVERLPDAPFHVDLTMRSLPGLKTLGGFLAAPATTALQALLPKAIMILA